MAKVVVIESYLGQGRPDNSLLLYAQAQFLRHYQQLHPDDEIIHLNLNDEAKLTTVLTTRNIAHFWDQHSLAYIDLITQADKLIISTNMINFTVSPTLRTFIDNILVPDKTFTYNRQGQSCGLLRQTLKAQLIMVQGDYQSAFSFAHFDTWLEHVLRFMGIQEIQTLVFDGVNTPEQAQLDLETKFRRKAGQFHQQVREF